MNQGWDHKTSFVPPLLAETSVPGKGGTVYLCVEGIDFDSFYDFLFYCGIVPIV